MKERRIGIRELEARLSECVRDVKSGVVTEHGRRLARLVLEAHSLDERLDAQERWCNLVERPARASYQTRRSSAGKAYGRRCPRG
jgi:antitoxin (DNA-binding transcriptional repressor) of toxin-antitoxin stability system